MKSASVVAVLFLALGAIPAFAEDGRISESSLKALGLSGMKAMSDAEGMEVRGMSSSVEMIVKGTSLIFGQLLTPDTKNFVVASSVNEVDGELVNHWAKDPVSLHKTHNVVLDLALNVEYDGFDFDGSIGGIAGGFGSVTTLSSFPAP